MSHEYNEQQIETVVIVHTATSIVSLIASLLVVLNYLAIPSLRTQLAYKLTICIAVSDVIFSLGNSMGAPSEGVMCHIQAISIQFGSISSVLWVVAVSFTINYLMTVKQILANHLKRMLYIMHMMIWSVSCTVSILPLFTNTYGPAGGWCWMKRDKMIDKIFRYALFYIPLWISIIYMIAIYISTWYRIKKMHQDLLKNKDDPEQSNCSGIAVEMPLTNDQKSKETQRTETVQTDTAIKKKIQSIEKNDALSIGVDCWVFVQYNSKDNGFDTREQSVLVDHAPSIGDIAHRIL
eukprot:753941_1